MKDDMVVDVSGDTDVDADGLDILDDDIGDREPDILEQVKARAREIGRLPDMGDDDDPIASAAGESLVIRVAADTTPKRLAFFIITRMKDAGGVAICQAIGPKANQNIDLAIVEAQSILVKYAPTWTIVALPCIRKPTMDNQEERTAIRKIIFAVNHKLVP